jgi:hypothetical protein
MSEREIRSIEPSRAPRGTPGGGPPPAARSRPREESPARGDEFAASDPRHGVLALLGQRILEATRRALELPDGPTRGEPRFAQAPAPSIEVWVGRLFSEQNLLASRGRPDWPLVRIHAAQERGFTDGFAETTEILEDVHGLDDAAWALLSAVLAEFHRKLANAAADA